MTKQETTKISKLPVEIKDLKKFFDEYLDEPRKDKYGLSWAGKINSKKEALTPTSKTLNPQKQESKNWDETENIFIEGDNLEALKLLQRKYFEKIKMIYIDPPYNTGKDFIYHDDFRKTTKEELEESGEMKDGKLLTTNAKTNGRFHSDWLNMMYSRLFLAHKLLKDDGVIFVSIDDNEVANLRLLMDEIFGEENFVECITWNKRVPKNDKGIGNIHEYILIYLKNAETKLQFLMSKEGLAEIESLRLKLKNQNIPIKDAEKEIRKFYKKKGYDRGITLYNSLDKDYRLWGKINMSWPNANTFGPKYEIRHPKNNKVVKVPARGWRWKELTFSENVDYKNIEELHDGSYKCGRIWFDKTESTQPSSILYLDEVNNFLLRSILSIKSDGGVEVEKIFGGKSFFSYPKPTALLNIIFKSVSLEDDIILDFFAGSGTTAHAVMDLNAEDGGNRKYICVQLNEEVDKKSEAGKAGYKNIAEIARERIRRAGNKIEEEVSEKRGYYNGLKDEMGYKEREIKEMQANEDGKRYDFDGGFRSFKISNSNYREWQAGDFEMFEEKLLEQAQLFTEKPLIDNYEEINVVFELVVKEGFSLASKISQEKEMWKIEDTDRRMFVDFGKKVETEKVEKLNLDENDIFVCFDSALNDSQKINLVKGKGRVLVI